MKEPPDFLFCALKPLSGNADAERNPSGWPPSASERPFFEVSTAQGAPLKLWHVKKKGAKNIQEWWSIVFKSI